MATTSSAQNESGRAHPVAWLALCVLVAGAALARIEVLTSDFTKDTGAWLYISKVMNEGFRPYADIWDNKLMPLYWIGQVALASGAERLALYLIDIAFTLAGSLGLASVLRTLGGPPRTGLLFGGLYIVASYPAWEGPNRLEVYAVGCLAIGLALVVKLSQAGSRRPALVACAAGFMLSWACSFRPQEVFTALLGGGLVLALAGPRRVAAFAAYVAGGSSVIAILLLAAWLGGYLPEMLREAVLGSIGYAAGATDPEFPILGKTLWVLSQNISRMSLAWLAAGGGLILLLGCLRRAAAPLVKVAVATTALVIVHFGVTFLGGASHQFTHYHYSVGWSAALLLGLGYCGWRGLQPRIEGVVRWAPELTLAMLLFVVLPFDKRVYGGMHRLLGARAPTKTDKLASFVRANVPADEGFLLMDGYDAIGALVELPNPLVSRWAVVASQLIYEDPARASQEPDPFFFTGASWGRIMLQRLEEEPVELMVRERDRQDELSAFLIGGYERVAQDEDFELWRRSR